jgi:ubiquinone/menaquinone biosynthesis C-methylase UbiE
VPAVPDPTAIQPRGVDVNIRSGPQMREYDAIADRIAADRPGRVLDWGCGLGQVTSLLRERGVETEPFDYREDVTEPTRRPLEHYPAVEAMHSNDPVALPYGDDEFDSVLSLGVLEHVMDPDASLEQLRRVLKPGGTFYVYKLPNRFSYLEWIAKRLGLYYHGKLPYDRLYDKRRTVALLERHGFDVLEFRRTNLLPLTIAHPLARRFSGTIWALNRALRFVPGLSLTATNVEAVARLAPAAHASPAQPVPS